MEDYLRWRFSSFPLADKISLGTGQPCDAGGACPCARFVIWQRRAWHPLTLQGCPGAAAVSVCGTLFSEREENRPFIDQESLGSVVTELVLVDRAGFSLRAFVGLSVPLVCVFWRGWGGALSFPTPLPFLAEAQGWKQRGSSFSGLGISVRPPHWDVSHTTRDILLVRGSSAVGLQTTSSPCCSGGQCSLVVGLHCPAQTGLLFEITAWWSLPQLILLWGSMQCQDQLSGPSVLCRPHFRVRFNVHCLCLRLNSGCCLLCVGAQRARWFRSLGAPSSSAKEFCKYIFCIKRRRLRHANCFHLSYLSQKNVSRKAEEAEYYVTWPQGMVVKCWLLARMKCDFRPQMRVHDL